MEEFYRRSGVEPLPGGFGFRPGPLEADADGPDARPAKTMPAAQAGTPAAPAKTMPTAQAPVAPSKTSRARR